jgi:hypothetical protein
VHIRVEFAHKLDVCILVFVLKALEVQRNPRIQPLVLLRVAARVPECRQELHDLYAQHLALARVPQHRPSRRVPRLRIRVVVVQVRKHLRIFPRQQDRALDPVHRIRIVHRHAVDHRVLAMAVVIDRQQLRLLAVHVQPLREKHVDLVYMLLE